jgi:hypothetical protein
MLYSIVFSQRIQIESLFREKEKEKEKVVGARK